MDILDKFTKFSFNYPAQFCLEIWQDERMAKHLAGKFSDCYNRWGSTGAMLGFYNGLDGNNAAIFKDWLMNNYNG